MQSTRNAYQYLKANALVNEMVERVLSNAEAASSYEGVTSDFSDQAIPSCVSDDSGCTAADRVTADQREWAELFIAAAKNGNEQTVLPDGLGAVEVDDDTSVIAVWVQWRQDDRANVAQSDTDCDEVPAGFIRVCARFSVLEGI
jgi:Tfp pilus assembly protein PilV